MKENKKVLPTKAGFTLVELLVVIAVLGTLAVVVLLALNPLQQLARTRDSGRSSAVTQIGHALEAYATTNNGDYPAASGWLTTLQTAGEIQSAPSAIAYNAGNAVPCTTNVINNLCYSVDPGSAAVVYATAEADSNINQCAGSGTAYFVYSSVAGRGGIACTTAEPNATSFSVSDFIN